MVENLMMSKGHYFVLLALSSITFCVCMPKINPHFQYDLQYLKDFNAKHLENFVNYLCMKKQYQTVLDILPDLLRMYPDSLSLYIKGGTCTWHLDHPNIDGFRVSFCDSFDLTNTYILKFLESSIGSGDYDTVRVALPLLERRVAEAQEYPRKLTPPSAKNIARIKRIREKMNKWEEIESNKQAIQTDTPMNVDSEPHNVP